MALLSEKICSVSPSLTPSFAQARTLATRTHARYAYQSKETQGEKYSPADVQHDVLLLVLVNVCVGLPFLGL